MTTPQQLFKWSPFTYICEGFDGQQIEINGIFPHDVRLKCPFTVLKIHGPVVKGLGSWFMYQLVNGDT